MRKKNGFVELPADQPPLVDGVPVKEAVESVKDSVAVAEVPLAEGEVPNEPKKPPRKTYRYMSAPDTMVEVALWEDSKLDETTKKWYRTHRVSFRRQYSRPVEGQPGKVEWVESKSFRAGDIPVLQHGLNRVYADLLEVKAGGYI